MKRCNPSRRACAYCGRPAPTPLPFEWGTERVRKPRKHALRDSQRGCDILLVCPECSAAGPVRPLVVAEDPKPPRKATRPQRAARRASRSVESPDQIVLSGIGAE